MPCGFIELATTPDRLEEFRRVAAFNKHCGVDVHEIGPNEVKDMFPLCDVSDISAGFYVPTDGRVNPVDATMALAKGATLYGCKTFTNTAVVRHNNNHGCHSYDYHEDQVSAIVDTSPGCTR